MTYRYFLRVTITRNYSANITAEQDLLVQMTQEVRGSRERGWMLNGVMMMMIVLMLMMITTITMMMMLLLLLLLMIDQYDSKINCTIYSPDEIPINLTGATACGDNSIISSIHQNGSRH